MHAPWDPSSLLHNGEGVASSQWPGQCTLSISQSFLLPLKDLSSGRAVGGADLQRYHPPTHTHTLSSCQEQSLRYLIAPNKWLPLLPPPPPHLSLCLFKLDHQVLETFGKSFSELGLPTPFTALLEIRDEQPQIQDL